MDIGSIEKIVVGICYITAATGLLVYGLNCYVMICLYLRGRKAEQQRRQAAQAIGDMMRHAEAPLVTTQIAIYNELNVAERVIRAACAMRYPAGRHEIQVVDDSNDETRHLIDRVVAEARQAGHEVRAVRRDNRHGFKAGALANALQQARGEFIAIFDADFVPPPDYLLRTIPYMMADAKLGLVQARWGHLNEKCSLLTRAQSIGIDGHFLIEQTARTFNGLYMNFNGTAGVWRRAAIEAGGGWHSDTLTEDLDLSYRAQLAGWQAAYVPDLVVPAELPEDITAFRGQQFRWAKGSIQTAIKLLPTVMRAPGSIFKKFEAIIHVTNYVVHPLILIVALLALPLLGLSHIKLEPWLYVIGGTAVLLSMIAPSVFYLVAQQVGYQDWSRRACWLPWLVMVGVGIALSNSRAILEAVLGRKSSFLRTPKRGDRELKRYTQRLPGIALLEIALGLYCAYSMSRYLLAGLESSACFIAMYAAGFLFVGLLSVAQTLGANLRTRVPPPRAA